MREYEPHEAAAIAARMRRKAERRREWEASANRAANQHHERSRDATAGIPFGQPILAGHHSQRRHERALERSWNQLGKAVEADTRAQHHARKAARAEGWANEVERRAAGPVYVKADLLPGDRVANADGKVREVIVRANAKSVTAWATHAGPVTAADDELRPLWAQCADRNPSRVPYLKLQHVWRLGADGEWFEVAGSGPGAEVAS